MPKSFRNLWLWIAPVITGWLLGMFLGLTYSSSFIMQQPLSNAGIGKIAAAISLIAMLMIAVVARSKIKSALTFGLLAFAGFVISIAILRSDLYSVKIIIEINLYRYVAEGLALGTLIACCAITLAQRYFPWLNRLKND